MAKKQTYSSDSWGTPEHEAWSLKTYGPPPTKAQLDREYRRLAKWTKGYQAYIARVHGR